MKEKCDFCKTTQEVELTGYGSSKFNRFICKKCKDKIKAYHKNTFSEKADFKAH